MKKLLEWKPVRFGLEVGELYFSKRVSRSAAELAYFLILTFFPVLICINAFIGLLHLDINAVLEAASPFLPRETLGILGDYIQYITGNQSPALLAAGGIMTLFSASAAFRALMNIMEDLYGRKSYAGVWRIAASVAFSVLFLLTIYLALVVLLTGGWLFHLVERLFRLETVTLPWDWQWFRFLLLFLSYGNCLLKVHLCRNIIFIHISDQIIIDGNLGKIALFSDHLILCIGRKKIQRLAL